MRTTIKLAVIVLQLLLTMGCTTVEFGEAEMFRPRPGTALSSEAISATGYGFQPIEIPTADGIHLRGVF
jgi:hypothetical protein